MIDIREKSFRKISSREEPFNYQFGALLGYSLEAGPELVSKIHKKTSVGENTELVALQDNTKLDDSIDGETFETDIVVQDQNSIIGIESKRLDTLKKHQLEGELKVLEQNAHGREVILIAITDDTTKPAVVTEVSGSTEHTVLWTSWHRVAERMRSANTKDKYKPIQKIMKDLFKDADYEIQFEGFPRPELDSQVYIKWQQQFKNLMFDVDKILQSKPLSLNRSSRSPNVPSYSHDSVSKLEHHYYQPAAVSLFAAFTHNEGRSLQTYGRDSYTCLYGNYHDSDIGVFLNISPYEIDKHREILANNSEDIVALALENSHFFRVSYNSHCNSQHFPSDLYEREQVTSFLNDKAGEEEGKRVMIGTLLDEEFDPREYVEKISEEIMTVYDTYYDDGEILGQFE